MTRINTNLSSLVAQKTLQRSNQQLNESLTRLSTGLRINAGKDDPAGLIASEVLRSDIISVRKAITNSERANQLIATADSALGQVSSLLNDIRGLVSEAANTGALSESQIQANQLQLDSSLEAIDRISQVTSFQGRRLLDGNLDFITSGVSKDIQDLQIDQANFGTLSQIGVGIDIVQQATQGKLTYAFDSIAEDVVLEVAGSNGTEAFNFAGGSSVEQIASAVNLVSDATGVKAQVIEQDAQAGSITVSSFGGDNDIVLTAKTAGESAGNYRVRYDATSGASALSVAYTAPSGETAGTIDVTLATTQWEAASKEINFAGVNNALKLSAKIKGEEFNGVKLAFANDTTVDNTPTFAYDHDAKTLTVTIDDGVTTAANVVTELANNAAVSALFSISHVGESDGSGTIDATTGAAVVTAFNTTGLEGGVDGGAITSTANDIIAAINGTSGLKDLVSASLAEGNDGHEAVTDFAAYAFYGTAAANNRLQFLAPDGTRNVQFVSTAGTSLSVDLSTDPEVEAKASAVVQSTTDNSSFVITAKTAGDEFNDIDIVFADSTDNTIVYDAEGKSLTFNVDLSGGINATEIETLFNADTYVSKFFDFAHYGDSTGGTDLAAGFTGTKATTSGGVTSEGTLIVNLATNSNGQITTTAQDLIDYFNSSDSAIKAQLEPLGISVTHAEGSDGSGLLAVTSSDLEFATSGRTFTDSQASVTTNAVGGATSQLTITAIESGSEYDGVEIKFEDSATAGSETFVYDSITKTLTIGIEDGVSTAAQVAASLADTGNEAAAALFDIDATDGTGAGTVGITDGGTTSGGVTIGGTTDGAAFLGNEDAGASGLAFVAADYGSDAFVSVKALSGTFALNDTDGNAAERSVGTDINARINGIQAIGRGLRVSVNTSSLDLSFNVSETVESASSYSFNITGGGALFQLGPDVVSNQQARLGIQSVSTATLGGVSGRLFELRSGGTKALDTNVGGAAAVVEEVITAVTSLRGRLGAFQKTTLETNIFTLNDTLVNLTEAESSIRDADFAAESANLTRAQILVQSGTSVLSIANSNPQNVLSLLR